MKKRVFYNDKMKAWFQGVADQGKIYPEIDPFHTVFCFADHVYSLYEENIDGGSAMWLHLIDGPEKALLVDTGGGIGDVKALVKHLVGDKPVYVVNTHEHWDHVQGNYQFDRVYCHPFAVPTSRHYRSRGKGNMVIYDAGQNLSMLYENDEKLGFRLIYNGNRSICRR